MQRIFRQNMSDAWHMENSIYRNQFPFHSHRFLPLVVTGTILKESYFTRFETESSFEFIL